MCIATAMKKQTTENTTSIAGPRKLALRGEVVGTLVTAGQRGTVVLNEETGCTPITRVKSTCTG